MNMSSFNAYTCQFLEILERSKYLYIHIYINWCVVGKACMFKKLRHRYAHSMYTLESTELSTILFTPTTSAHNLYKCCYVQFYHSGSQVMIHIVHGKHCLNKLLSRINRPDTDTAILHYFIFFTDKTNWQYRSLPLN